MKLLSSFLGLSMGAISPIVWWTHDAIYGSDDQPRTMIWANDGSNVGTDPFTDHPPTTEKYPCGGMALFNSTAVIGKYCSFHYKAPADLTLTGALDSTDPATDPPPMPTNIFIANAAWYSSDASATFADPNFVSAKSVFTFYAHASADVEPIMVNWVKADCDILFDNDHDEVYNPQDYSIADEFEISCSDMVSPDDTIVTDPSTKLQIMGSFNDWRIAHDANGDATTREFYVQIVRADDTAFQPDEGAIVTFNGDLYGDSCAITSARADPGTKVEPDQTAGTNYAGSTVQVSNDEPIAEQKILGFWVTVTASPCSDMHSHVQSI